MKARTCVPRGLATLIGVVVLFAPQLAQAELIFATTAGTQRLVSFDSAAPNTLTSDAVVTGLQAGELLLGIDFRPATGELYALGSTSRLYTLNTTSGAATQVGAAGAFTLSGASFGFDFNPTVDRIRVTSDADQNLRLNPNGTLTGTDASLAYDNTTADGDPIDANAGANPNVVGSAYTNNFAGAMATTLYGIDSGLDILVIQNPPNNGTLNSVGALGVDANDFVGFDISGGTGMAYAALGLAGVGVSQFYTINLSTGAATLVGTPGTFSAISGIAVAPVPEPATVLLLGTGLALAARRRFRRRRQRGRCHDTQPVSRSGGRCTRW